MIVTWKLTCQLFYLSRTRSAGHTAPPVANNHRPATPQFPPAFTDSSSTAAPPSRTSGSSGSTNKYGITVPSMNDFKDPRFQSAFKFAGSSMSAAGGLLNKHVLGGQNHHESAPAAASPPPPPPAAAPSRASKPSSFRVSVLALAP